MVTFFNLGPNKWWICYIATKMLPLKANIFAMLGQRELILAHLKAYLSFMNQKKKESCFVSANCYGSLNIISQGWKMW